MAEDLTLTEADSITSYRVAVLVLNHFEAKIKVHVRDPVGRLVVCSYSGAIATTLMNQLNTMNLTTSSLHRRILERLSADGKLPAGIVTGTPD